MNCTSCNSENYIKKGFQNNKQRYYCKNCKVYFQEEYSYSAYKKLTNTMIKNLLKEGCGIRSIARVLKISKNTVLSRMLKISKYIKAPQFNSMGCKFEMDEIWSFVGNKSNVNWITYAIEQNSKIVIGFIVGAETKENIQPNH